MTQAEYVFRRIGISGNCNGSADRTSVRSCPQRWLFATRAQAGWRGVGVGQDAGSIMSWMGEIVGLTGQVVAVDLEPKFLSQTRHRM